MATMGSWEDGKLYTLPELEQLAEEKAGRLQATEPQEKRVPFWDREPWWSIGFLLFGCPESKVLWLGFILGNIVTVIVIGTLLLIAR